MNFDDWFEEKYGPPPSSVPITRLLQDVQDAETRLTICNMKYAAMEHYNLQRAAAKMAWSYKTDWHSV